MTTKKVEKWIFWYLFIQGEGLSLDNRSLAPRNDNVVTSGVSKIDKKLII